MNTLLIREATPQQINSALLNIQNELNILKSITNKKNSGEDVEEKIADLQNQLNMLAEVARSGSYNDLINKPSIPEINDNITSSTTLWSSEKVNDKLSSKRVYPLFVNDECKASDLTYFAMKNPDGWIDISLTIITVRTSSIHNGDIIFKHKLGSYIQKMFPTSCYRVPGMLDRYGYRQNIGYDINIDGTVRGYFHDGVFIGNNGGYDDISGLYGVNLRIYAPDYEDD